MGVHRVLATEREEMGGGTAFIASAGVSLMGGSGLDAHSGRDECGPSGLSLGTGATIARTSLMHNQLTYNARKVYRRKSLTAIAPRRFAGNQAKLASELVLALYSKPT